MQPLTDNITNPHNLIAEYCIQIEGRGYKLTISQNYKH